jgi:glycosyl transferase family 1
VTAEGQVATPELEEVGTEAIEALRLARIPAIIWGHPLGTHTHSWIHYGFARAFERLGFDVMWLEDTPESAQRVAGFERAIVLAETQQDRHLRAAVKPSWLVLAHNCDRAAYAPVDYWVQIQVRMLDKSGYRNPKWHPEVLEQGPDALIAPPDPGQIDIFWATDLLPEEIEFIPHREDSRDVVFVGSVWSYNRAEVKRFRRRLRAHGLKWKAHKNVDQERHMRLIKEARFAPSLQGEWQVDHGYIPCRLFKNISYSQLAISNNPNVGELFGEDQAVCDRDLEGLVAKMLATERDGAIDEMVRSAQEEVRSRHTYLNRIAELLGFAATREPGMLTSLGAAKRV